MRKSKYGTCTCTWTRNSLHAYTWCNYYNQKSCVCTLHSKTAAAVRFLVVTGQSESNLGINDCICIYTVYIHCTCICVLRSTAQSSNQYLIQAFTSVRHTCFDHVYKMHGNRSFCPATPTTHPPLPCTMPTSPPCTPPLPLVLFPCHFSRYLSLFTPPPTLFLPPPLPVASPALHLCPRYM